MQTRGANISCFSRVFRDARTIPLDIPFWGWIHWCIGFEASDPDKLLLVELCNSKIIDQDFFWVLEMVFSDSVPKVFIILLA